jgi:hypothetical protein
MILLIRPYYYSFLQSRDSVVRIKSVLLIGFFHVRLEIAYADSYRLPACDHHITDAGCTNANDELVRGR